MSSSVSRVAMGLALLLLAAAGLVEQAAGQTAAATWQAPSLYHKWDYLLSVTFTKATEGIQVSALEPWDTAVEGEARVLLSAHHRHPTRRITAALHREDGRAGTPQRARSCRATRPWPLAPAAPAECCVAGELMQCIGVQRALFWQPPHAGAPPSGLPCPAPPLPLLPLNPSVSPCIPEHPPPTHTTHAPNTKDLRDRRLRQHRRVRRRDPREQRRRRLPGLLLLGGHVRGLAPRRGQLPRLGQGPRARRLAGRELARHPLGQRARHHGQAHADVQGQGLPGGRPRQRCATLLWLRLFVLCVCLCWCAAGPLFNPLPNGPADARS